MKHKAKYGYRKYMNSMLTLEEAGMQSRKMR